MKNFFIKLFLLLALAMSLIFYGIEYGKNSFLDAEKGQAEEILSEKDVAAGAGSTIDEAGNEVVEADNRNDGVDKSAGPKGDEGLGTSGDELEAEEEIGDLALGGEDLRKDGPTAGQGPTNYFSRLANQFSLVITNLSNYLLEKVVSLIS